MDGPRFDVPRHFRAPVAFPGSEWLHNQSKSQAGQDLFVIAMTQGMINGSWLEIGCGDPIRSNNTYLLEKRLGWSGISIDAERMDQDMVTPFEEYWQSFYDRMKQDDWPQQLVPFDQLPDSIRVRFGNDYHNFIARQITDIDQMPKDQRSWNRARPGTRFYQQDALQFDYDQVPSSVDYLQIDIHPSLNNLRILERVLPRHRFSVITFEHDVWDHTPDSVMVRDRSREMLQDSGYQLVISDATVPPGHGNGIGDEPINFEDWWVDPERIPEAVWQRYQNLSSTGEPKYYYHTLLL